MTPAHKGHPVKLARMAFGASAARAARAARVARAAQPGHKEGAANLGPKVTPAYQGPQALRGPLVQPDRAVGPVPRGLGGNKDQQGRRVPQAAWSPWRVQTEKYAARARWGL